MSRPPSSNAYTHLVSVAVAMELSHQTAEAHVCVMFRSLGHRTIYGSQGVLGRYRGVEERLRERIDHELVRLLAERERAGFAARADDSAGSGGERAKVLALAAGGAGGELGDEA